MQGLGLNQCAYCKQEGHWTRECPNRFNQGNQFQQEDVSKVMVLGQSVSQEPLKTLQLGDKEVKFLIDTGATHAVLNYLEE